MQLHTNESLHAGSVVTTAISKRDKKRGKKRMRDTRKTRDTRTKRGKLVSLASRLCVYFVRSRLLRKLEATDSL